MNKIYHVKFATDGEATKAFWELGPAIANAEGHRHIAPSQGHGPAYLVAHLPEEVDPASIFSGHEYQNVPTAPAENVELPTTDEQEDEDDYLPFDDDDEEDDEDDYPEGDYPFGDEEDEDDQPKEDSGDESGTGDSEASTEPGAESSEATAVGSTEVSAE